MGWIRKSTFKPSWGRPSLTPRNETCLGRGSKRDAARSVKGTVGEKQQALSTRLKTETILKFMSGCKNFKRTSQKNPGTSDLGKQTGWGCTGRAYV